MRQDFGFRADMVRDVRLGYMIPMPYSVSAYADDHIVSVDAATAKDALAKAVEWEAVGSLSDVSITDGINRYSIAEFSSILENAGDDDL